MNEDVFASLSQVLPLTDEMKLRLNSILKVRTFKKKDLLLKEGEVCSNLFFIAKGLLRVYYKIDGEEVCSGLLSEGGVCISVPSFFQRKRSYENIQAIEETTVYYHSYEDLEKMYDDFVEYNILGRKLLTEYYVRSEERNFWLRKQSARKKYQFFKEKFGDVVNRIPIKDIASYLGMEIETLSRIRRRI